MKISYQRKQPSPMNLKGPDGEDLYFSNDEVALIWFFMTGLDTCEIAGRMNVSVKKLYYYRSKIMKKISVKNNAEFLHWFIIQRKSFTFDRVELSILNRRGNRASQYQCKHKS